MKIFSLANKTFLLIITVFLLVGTAHSAFASPRIVVGNDTIEVGGAATIPMTVEADGASIAFQFFLDFDESQFTATPNCAPTIPATSGDVPVWICDVRDRGDGDLWVMVIYIDLNFSFQPILAGEHSLGTISFQHIGGVTGDYPLIVEGDAFGDETGTDIPADDPVDGQITVGKAHGNQKEKIRICHVGNEMGPNGEVYDPACVPGEDNDYFCADAGKIDLIVTAKPAKHLNNPSHEWDGISDYEPSEIGASGDGTEDSDGNGVDDGCEPADVCPCWDVTELQAVTAANQHPEYSCSNYIYWVGRYPDNIGVATTNTPGGVSFIAYGPNWYGFENNCLSVVYPSTYNSIIISDEELAICANQIADRCAAIGDPIVP